MTVPPRPPWDNPATPEPRRRLPRAAKTASAKKQEAEKEEAKKPIRKVATPKKLADDEDEKPKKKLRKITTPKKMAAGDKENLMKMFRKLTTPKKIPAPIDPDMVPLPPSGGRRSVTRPKKSPKPKTTKNSPKKIGRPVSTKKKTSVRGKKPEDNDVESSPGDSDDPGPIVCPPNYPPDYYGFPVPQNFLPPDAHSFKPWKPTRRTPSRKDVSTKKKTPVRGKETEEEEGVQSHSEGHGFFRTGGRWGKSVHDDIPTCPPGGIASLYPPQENEPLESSNPTRRTPSRKTDEKKVIRKKVIRRNKKTAHFEEVIEGGDEGRVIDGKQFISPFQGVDIEYEGGPASDVDFISIEVGDTKVNFNINSKTQKGKAKPKATELNVEKEMRAYQDKNKKGKKPRGRPRKNAVVKDNKIHPWKEGDGSIPAPTPGFGFGNGLTPTGGFGFGGIEHSQPLIDPSDPNQPARVGPSSFGNFGPFGAEFRPTDTWGLGVGDPEYDHILSKVEEGELRKIMRENDGCDCSIKNPIYPYGENGEGGPGIGYTCTCPLGVGANCKWKGKRYAPPAELTLQPGESFYRSGAGLFKDGIMPPGVYTGFELSSYCEHKLPPKPNSPLIWDPTNNVQCGNCPRRPRKTPGSCNCPLEEAFIFTVRAKIHIDGKDDWSAVRDGDKMEKRGHCYKCDKLVRKDDPVKGIGEPYDLNSKTFQRMADYMDGREDRAEEEEAAAFNETLGFNPDGTPKVGKNEPVMYKKWNRNGWSDKEVKKAEETRHKQWSRANDQDYGKPKKGKQPPSNEGTKICECEERGGCPKDRNGECACKGKAGGCNCTKRGGSCSC
jgi:hypothetical protein